MTIHKVWKPTLPDKFVGTLATSPSPLNVGLHDAKYKRAKNNIERGRGAKGYRVGVYNTVSQLIMSGSVVRFPGMSGVMMSVSGFKSNRNNEIS